MGFARLLIASATAWCITLPEKGEKGAKMLKPAR